MSLTFGTALCLLLFQVFARFNSVTGRLLLLVGADDYILHAKTSSETLVHLWVVEGIHIVKAHGHTSHCLGKWLVHNLY